MDIVIKKTTEFEAGLGIAKSLPEFFSAQGLREIEEQLPIQSMFGAYLGEELIGFVSYKKLNDEAIDLTWLMVKEKYQAKGIGAKLVLDSLATFGKDFLVCQVKTLAETVEDEGYAKTRAFYKKIGFVPIAIVDPYPGWGSGNPCQIMVKFLGK